MQFRLTYQGPLPSGRHNKEHKHAIRRKIHMQLAELWRINHFLRDYIRIVGIREGLFAEHERCGYRFVPLIGGRFKDIACRLDVLFLRRGAPGGLITKGKGGGDIDNRIKVLFDALRMPQECSELKNMPPQAGEDPFFCLMKDDDLVTEMHVTTDELLTPTGKDEHANDVHLVIHVRTLVTGAQGLGVFGA